MDKKSGFSKKGISHILVLILLPLLANNLLWFFLLLAVPNLKSNTSQFLFMMSGMFAITVALIGISLWIFHSVIQKVSSLTNQTEEAHKSDIDTIALIAHELRNPLTVTKGYLYLFQEESKKKLSAKQKGFLERMASATQDLLNLIDDLLSASRIEKGMCVLVREMVDIKQIVKQTVDEWQIRAKEKKIRLSLLPSSEVFPLLSLDKQRMHEVFTNLLANALDHTPEKGMMQISIQKEADMVRIDVSDTGHGIDPSDLPLIFNKFYRGKNNVQHGILGTGLGLFVVKSLVELHGGSIHVSSIVGQGSTFSVRLPLVQSS